MRFLLFCSLLIAAGCQYCPASSESQKLTTKEVTLSGEYCPPERAKDGFC